ncbi:MAG: helix-turn-helix domain-containing protein [Sphingomonadales bacterium]|nr:helix-turn-helix domain-containing protein [Sphingomonadales bacterium]
MHFADLAHHLEEQIRGSTSPATVTRYRLAMKNGEQFPPLLVADVGGALVLVDGFHRRDAREELGEESGLAKIVPCVDLREARWMGFDANLRHGQPLKPKLLRPALRAYVDAGHHRTAKGKLKSYRDIAAELPGVSYSTVRRWIEIDFPAVFREMAGEDNDAPGGLWERDPQPTAEQQTLEGVLAHIAEARALLSGVTSVEARGRVEEAARALLTDLTWEDGGGVDLGDYLGEGC